MAAATAIAEKKAALPLRIVIIWTLLKIVNSLRISATVASDIFLTDEIPCRLSLADVN